MRYNAIRQLHAITVAVWVLTVSWISVVSHLSFGRFNLRTIESYWCYIILRATLLLGLLFVVVVWCYTLCLLTSVTQSFSTVAEILCILLYQPL